MIEEPYRWLEAVEHRREYVRDQLQSGLPALSASLEEGMLLISIGRGDSKVFELFDRQGMVALGHAADIERIRQTTIDAAHVEAFVRSPQDVCLRRLVGYNLSPMLKESFETIHQAPFLVEALLVEVGPRLEDDVYFRIHYDGSFEQVHGPVVVVARNPALGGQMARWIEAQVAGPKEKRRFVDAFLQAWWLAESNHDLKQPAPPEPERRRGWRELLKRRGVEIGWLDRSSGQTARYRKLKIEDVEL